MAVKNIKWKDGGVLSIDYTGDGDGSAIFTSDINEGIDREMQISFFDTLNTVRVSRTLFQAGSRDIFKPRDGDFILSDSGTFNVLK